MSFFTMNTYICIFFLWDINLIIFTQFSPIFHYFCFLFFAQRHKFHWGEGCGRGGEGGGWSHPTTPYSTVMSHILRYCKDIFRFIQANLAPYLTLAYSQLCHIPSPGIFRTDSRFKILRNFDQTYSEPCHNQNCQNSLFRHYSAIFRHIQNLV